MADYLVLWGDLEAAPAAALMARLSGPLQAGWTWAVQAEQVAVLVTSTRPLAVNWSPSPPSLVIGDVWARDNGADLQRLLARPDARAQAQALCAQAWGRYVAILDDGAVPAIFRDPSGGLEALTWRSEGLTLVASGLTAELIAALAPRLSLDWDQVARMMAAPANLCGRLALDGLSAVAPGELLRRADGREVHEPLWTPAAFMTRAPETPDVVRGRLVRLVDTVVGAWAAERERLLVEVSGGLDSAIVASALARRDDAQVAQWLNYYASAAEGDERDFARAFGDLYGVPITCVAKPFRPIDAEGLAMNAGGVRPSLMGLDYLRDADVAQRCAVLGAEAILTGQGGDAIFAQRLTPLALSDRVLRHGLGQVKADSLRDLADWTGGSAWGVLAQALRGVRGRTRAVSGSAPGFLTDAVRNAPVEVHPWLLGLEDAPPGKRQQIERLVQSQLVTGDSQRGRAAKLIHPLLAQPLVEYSLGVPVDILTELRRDRALARKAFAPRLPEAVLNRRSKGDMTAHYGRWVSASLPFLRAFLLEGALADKGIIDRDRLARLLTPEQLAWGADYVAILFAAVMEAWVRHWEATCQQLSQR